jgi:sugar O-acyltransferase (sialic acid O-acetyltransferase NeuD family)
MKKAIIGNGGFAREVFSYLSAYEKTFTYFFVEEPYVNLLQNVRCIDEIDFDEYEVIVAISDPPTRKRIVESLPNNARFFNVIHQSCVITSYDVSIGDGCVIAPGTVITTNVKIGNHAQINHLNSIGHDVSIGDYFTSAPCVSISGNCAIGDLVYLGSNSSVKQKTSICDNATIGMNCCVVKDIEEPGTYVGIPSKKIK